jgi:preprotein translocase subunit SecE
MAVDVARPPQGTPPAASAGWFSRTWSSMVEYYRGIVAEMKKVTWPDRPQVRQATIAIIIFVLILALLITLMDYLLSALLVHLIPSLFGGR